MMKRYLCKIRLYFFVFQFSLDDLIDHDVELLIVCFHDEINELVDGTTKRAR